MKALGIIFSEIAVFALLLLSMQASGADSPLEIIQSIVQKTLAVLRNPALQGRAHRRERLGKAEDLILLHFDVQEFSREALGPHWRQGTPAEQQEFVGLFTNLVARTYTDDIDREAKDVKVFFDKERVDSTQAEVATRVVSSSESRSVSIRYMMHQVNGHWLIYDVQIDNVSMALNYRSQFDHILNDSSYTELIQRIRAKLQEFGATA
jgi:phospholipid transport system substrate-binding protein